MKYRIVTTCNKEGYQKYGRRMISSLLKYWPEDVAVHLYNEGFEPPCNVIPHSFPEWHDEFKLRHRDNPKANGNDKTVNRKGRAHDYRYDAVRFSHKVAAITDVAQRFDDGVLIWCDADTVTHDYVSTEWIESLFPVSSDKYIAWLDRANKYPECGFLMFNCSHEQHKNFMSVLAKVYQYDTIFRFKETHDSYVIEQLVKEYVTSKAFPEPYSLSGPKGRKTTHPFVLSRLAEKMDHLKGNIKNTTKKTPGYMAPGRTESYWKS